MDRQFLTRHLSSLWRLRSSVALVWRSSPALTLLRAFLACAVGLLPVASLYLIKLIIDVVVNGAAEYHGNENLVFLLLSAAGVAIATDCLRGLDAYVGELHSHHVVDYVHQLLIRQSVRLGLSYYENSDFQDGMHRVQSDAPYRLSMIVDKLIRAFQGTVSLAGLLLFMAAIQWQVTAAIFVAMLPILVLQLMSSNSRHLEWRNQTSRIREKHYILHLLTHRDHAKEVSVFDLGPYFQDAFRRIQESLRRDQCAAARNRAIESVIAHSCASAAMYGSLAYVAYQTLARQIHLGSLVVYFQALLRAQGALRELFGSLVDLFESSLFLSSFHEFLSLQPSIADNALAAPLFPPVQGEIQFENIGFRYPHSGRGVLKNFNLRIEPGETVALVGRNGAGKTTIIKLLCRLYDPTEGRILIDGVDLRNIATAAWRKEIAVVFQDFGRYQFTARENIAFGDLSALDCGTRVEEAARLSGAAETIARLPSGYDTRLGTLFVGGEELSVGQWQQIAIARAAVRQASIIVLDEPASGLDPQAEVEALARFRRVTKGRTTILVSHRLSAVSQADRIVVIEGGEVLESGTHAELTKRRGVYAEMFRAQSHCYQNA